LKKFNRVAIIGVGLIGGSIGLAIRKKRLAREVVGVCRTSRSLRAARRKGAFDWGTTDLSRAVRGADLVILAAPIRNIPPLAQRLSRVLEAGTIVTDVASTKGLLVKAIEQALPKGIAFVGSHPMAGRETSGVGSAEAHLFQGKVCFVTRHRRTAPGPLRRVCALWRKIGSSVKVVGVEEHDRLVASLSHLPHVVAALVVLNAKRIELAGTGFKDMTRIASSDPFAWRDILLSNQKEILKSLGHFQKRVGATAALLRRKKGEQILSQLQKARRLRQGRRIR